MHEIEDLLAQDGAAWREDVDARARAVVSAASDAAVTARGGARARRTRPGSRRWARWAPLVAAAVVIAVAVPTAVLASSGSGGKVLGDSGRHRPAAAHGWPRHPLPGWGGKVTIAVPPGWL